ISGRGGRNSSYLFALEYRIVTDCPKCDSEPTRRRSLGQLPPRGVPGRLHCRLYRKSTRHPPVGRLCRAIAPKVEHEMLRGHFPCAARALGKFAAEYGGCGVANPDGKATGAPLPAGRIALRFGYNCGESAATSAAEPE